MLKTTRVYFGVLQYLCISISPVTPTGDLNKYKKDRSTSTCISNLCISISPVTPTGDLNKYKIDRSTSMCISTFVYV